MCERERKRERVARGMVPVGVVRESAEMCVGCGSGKSICGMVYGSGGGVWAVYMWYDRIL